MCRIIQTLREGLPSIACCWPPPAGRSSVVMSTSILPVKEGAKDWDRIGADKRTTSCSPSLVVGSLIEKTGPIITVYHERERAVDCWMIATQASSVHSWSCLHWYSGINSMINKCRATEYLCFQQNSKDVEMHKSTEKEGPLQSGGLTMDTSYMQERCTI